MDNKAFRDWLFILIVLAIALVLVYFLNTRSNQCLVNPIPYELKQIEKSNPGSTATCSCSFVKPGSIGQTVNYNSTNQMVSQNQNVLP